MKDMTYIYTIAELRKALRRKDVKRVRMWCGGLQQYVTTTKSHIEREIKGRAGEWTVPPYWVAILDGETIRIG